MSSLFDLAGRTALITGSVRGIGLSLAEGLAEAGASVIINGRRQEAVDAAVARLRDKGYEARDPAAAERAALALIDRAALDLRECLPAEPCQTGAAPDISITRKE